MRRTILKRGESRKPSSSRPVAGEAPTYCELTALQRRLVPKLVDPACPVEFANGWVNAEAFRIKPGVSSRRVERAMQQLVRRHDILRLHFQNRREDGWIGCLHPPEAMSLRVEDHGTVSEEELLRIVTAQANEPMPVDSEFLCDIRTLNFGDLGTVVLARIHHALSDGYGLICMAEDLVKLILNFPFQARPLSHLEYLREFDSKLPAFEGAVEAYWRDLMFPPPPMPRLGRRARGKEPLDDPALCGLAAVHDIAFGKKAVKQLTKRASRSGGTFFTLMSAAFAEVLYDLDGVEDAVFMGVLGRSEAALQTYAGCHIHFPLLRVRRADGDTLEERASALSRQITASQQRLCDETAHLFGNLGREIRAAGGHDFQFGVHIGGADGRARNSMLSSLLRARKGTEISLGPISVAWLDLKRDIAMPMEMRVSLLPHDDGATIKVVYDTEAFETEEAADITRRLVDKLVPE